MNHEIQPYSFSFIFPFTDSPLVPVLMAPAVTPWRSTIPGMGANNPGLRYYTYDRHTGTILDYHQYFLNLSQANAEGAEDWVLEYQATEVYNITDVSATSMHALVNSFLRKDDELFKKYFLFNTVGYDTVSDCGSECKQMHICAIMFVDYDQYQKCMQKYEREHLVPYKIHKEGGEGRGNGTLVHRIVNVTHFYHGHAPHPYPPGPRPAVHHHVPGYMHYVIYGLVTLVVVLFLVITLLCCCFRPNNRVVYFTQPRYVLVS